MVLADAEIKWFISSFPREDQALGPLAPHRLLSSFLFIQNKAAHFDRGPISRSPTSDNNMINTSTHIARTARTLTSGLGLLLILLFFLSHAPTACATGCFKADGSTSHDDEWPCDPDADTSLCCGAADYCLGSVMCLDTGSDNRLSLQGCTNSSWPDACNPVCPGTSAFWAPFSLER